MYIIDKLRAEESGLVVAYFDVAKLLVFTALLFVILGPVMDAAWSYIHTMSTTTDLYTTSDLQTVDSGYNFYKYIPMISLGVAIYFIVNYSNTKRSE